MIKICSHVISSLAPQINEAHEDIKSYIAKLCSCTVGINCEALQVIRDTSVMNSSQEHGCKTHESVVRNQVGNM